ncbi:GAK system XXXCH domain-containing protein [Desulfovermiculus halophilus]|uniref:GAK system XXXCH domain-containing protein n=1 Tax=Desulfovermiculus halophilus TaxID=339722 RepID=UPI000684D262|nr:GAK system XXXCH domain-containing protein [Desulfovermiculus halophilus]
MNEKRRYTFEVSKTELGRFLRTLADSLENDAAQVEEFGLDLSNMRKMKLSAKSWPDEPFHLKVKVTPWQAEEGDDDEGEEAVYARLKKRMKAYYKELGANLRANQQPSREIVTVFLQDCARMTEFIGYGDEFYPGFTQACQEFQEAFDREELAAMQRAFDHIESLKDRCHDRYK